MNNETPKTVFTERLWPSIGFFLALLLVVPGLMVLMLPFNTSGGVFIGIGVYLAIALLFVSTSARIEANEKKFRAGRGVIEREFLGEAEALDRIEFRQAIGRKLDARAFLLLNGWVKTGIRITVTDENDPTPYWIVATRRPERLAEFLNQKP